MHGNIILKLSTGLHIITTADEMTITTTGGAKIIANILANINAMERQGLNVGVVVVSAAIHVFRTY